MYEVRETAGTDRRIVLVTQEIGEVVRHLEVEGFAFVTDVCGTKLFSHTDGRTSAVQVVVPR
jgi:hypothetical protein